MIKYAFIFILIVFSSSAWSQNFELDSLASYADVTDIPDPKLSNGGGYVSNPDGIMDADDVALINEKLAALELIDSFQVAIVAVNSIGKNVIEDFAAELFEHWAIGHAVRDDGLLVLFVNDQRRIKFETGYGMSVVLPDTRCYEIQQEFMVPAFKLGAYSKGLKDGAFAIADDLKGLTVETFEPETDEDYSNVYEYRYDADGEIARYRKNREKQALERKKKRDANYKTLLLGVIVWHAIGLIIFAFGLLIIRLKQDPYDKFNVIRHFHFWAWIFLFPITHIFIYHLAKNLKFRYRNMLRFSDKNGELMRKLNDADEDKFLSSGQLSEELIKSVDYDVWITEKSEDILVLGYNPRFTKFKPCPKCTFKTFLRLHDEVLKIATTSAAGSVRRKMMCANCKHEVEKTYVIPKIKKRVRVSSSSSGWASSVGRSLGSSWSSSRSSSRSSSSSSRRSSSSSSSSRSSWGGGKSGGGGASSSW